MAESPEGSALNPNQAQAATVAANSDATALVHRNLIGVLLGVALLFVGFTLWLFLGRWGKQSRAVARRVFCCNRRRRKCAAALPDVQWEHEKGVHDWDSVQCAEPGVKAPLSELEKGTLKLPGNMKIVRLSKERFPTMQNSGIVSAQISVTTLSK
ncbi:hypothetical protein PENSPDRAFT_410802 [Peniophora sp. CONT]|nr:hypothetical protein PENSPDRAFT_410802 [Peniophora sp. CONT]